MLKRNDHARQGRRVKLRLKKGDLVKVMAGKHKGLEAPIMKINHEHHRVVVKGIVVQKHIKPSQRDEEGGIRPVPAYIHVSNVVLMHPKQKKKRTKVAYQVMNGKKVRVTRTDRVPLG